YCFTLLTTLCNHACCNVDLKKIEFNVYESCLVSGASVSATINGLPTSVLPSYDRPQYGPPGSAILRVTQLGLNTSHNLDQICITLKPNRAGLGCTTLEQMCVPPAGMGPGSCLAAMFDYSLNCCPTVPIGYMQPPPPSPSPPPPSPPPPPPPSPPLPPPPSPPPPPPSPP
ncbi:hypothetical protein VaNZ11_015761, partial [Volvox africanus]